MEIKTGDEIHVEIADNSPDRSIMTGKEYNQCLNEDKKRCNKKWVDIADLIERIETICNHGNERDMRFRNHLIKSLSIGFVILTKEGEKIWKDWKIPFLTKEEAKAELKDLRKHNYKEMIGAKVIPLE